MKSLFNKSFPLIICAILIYGCNSTISKTKKPRIAIAGLAIESSTFSPARSGVNAFLAREGKDVFKYYPFLSEESEQRIAADWVPTLRGHALPGGMVTKKAYDSLVGKTLILLKKG